MFKYKTFFSLIAICVVLFANSQDLNSELELTKQLKGKVKSVKFGSPCRSSGPKISENCMEYTVWNLNEQGKLLSILNQQPDGKLVTDNIFTYDKKGHKTDEFGFFYGKTRSHFNYDEKGNCVEAIVYDSVGKIMTSRRFDSHANEIESDWYSSDNPPIKSTSSTTTYFYNTQELEDSDHTYNNQGKLLMVRFFNYDAHGRIVKSRAYHVENNSLLLGDSSCYDARGNEVEHITFNNAGGIAERTVSKYDEHNNLIEGYYYGANRAEPWKTVVKYEYDKTGNWTKLTETNSDRKEVNTRLFEYY